MLTDLKLDMGGVETDLMYPREMPDLFRGTQVTLIGRYRNARDLENVRLRLAGDRATRDAHVSTTRISASRSNADENDFLPRLWATRRVGWLMEQIRTNGEHKELRDEIVDLGTRYGIVTPYTSYLALEARTAGGRGRRRAPRHEQQGASATGRRGAALPAIVGGGLSAEARRRAPPPAAPPPKEAAKADDRRGRRAREQARARAAGGLARGRRGRRGRRILRGGA